MKKLIAMGLGIMSLNMSSQEFVLTSPDFASNGAIPTAFSGEGQDKSPRLRWSGAPDTTKSFVLIVDDPDAPGRLTPYVHWVVYNIPATHTNLDYITDKSPQFSQGTMQGISSFGQFGYNGPFPPVGHGAHRYRFILYAIDKSLPLKPGAKKATVLRAIKGHVVGKAELMGTYERKK